MKYDQSLGLDLNIKKKTNMPTAEELLYKHYIYTLSSLNFSSPKSLSHIKKDWSLMVD